MEWHNVGGVDRIVRVVIGLILAVAVFRTTGAVEIIAGVLALIALVTGIAGMCPLYRLVGIRTCPLPKTR